LKRRRLSAPFCFKKCCFRPDRFAPSIAMAAKSFERILLSRARSAAFGGQQTLDSKILSKHTAAIAIDGFL
jgi:hypothetical protein